MRGARDKRRPVALAALIAALALALAATAFAIVTVYRNNLGTRNAAHELESARGQHCDRRWRDRREDVIVTVKRGSDACGYRPPVEGDSDQSDHSFLVRFKVLRETARSARDNAWVGLAVRSGGDSGYELRVFPRGGSYVIRRSPDGPGFPQSGTDAAIKGIEKRNRLELRAFDDVISAFVNGTKVDEVTDASPGQVGGRRLELIVGNTSSGARDVVATFDELAVSVPNP